MKSLIAAALFTLTSLAATADNRVRIEPLQCREYGFSEYSALAIQNLKAAINQVQCGRVDAGLQMVNNAQKIMVRELTPGIGVTPRGSCYDQRGCTGNILGTATVEKGTCNAAGGKSWRQQTPSLGLCVNI